MSNSRPLKNPLINLIETANALVVTLGKIKVEECKSMLTEAQSNYKTLTYWKSFLKYVIAVDDPESLTPLINELSQENILIKIYGRLQQDNWIETSLNTVVMKEMIKKLQDYNQTIEWPHPMILAFKQLLTDKILASLVMEMFNKEKALQAFVQNQRNEVEKMTQDLSQSQLACSMKTQEILSVSLISVNKHDDGADVMKLQDELGQLVAKAEKNEEKYLIRFKELEEEHKKLKEEFKLYKHSLPNTQNKTQNSTSTMLNTMNKPQDMLQSWVVVNDAEKVPTKCMQDSQNNNKPIERTKSRTVLFKDRRLAPPTTKNEEFLRNLSFLGAKLSQKSPEIPPQPENRNSLVKSGM